MNRKKKNREWLFILLFPIGYGYLYLLKNFHYKLDDYGVIWLSIFLLIVINVVGIYAFSYDAERKQQKSEETFNHTKGIEIVINFPKKMPTNPYCINEEKFLKIKFFPKYIESILLLGTILSLFFPWISSGVSNLYFYNFFKFDNFEFEFLSLFFIPLLIIFLINYKKLKAFISLVLGVMPFLLLFLFSNKEIEAIEFLSLSYGFYFCLFIALFLIALFVYRVFNKRIVLDRRQIVFSSRKVKLWLALGIIGTFFLPWLKIDLCDVKGYELFISTHNLKNYWSVLFIPFFSILLAFIYRFEMKIKRMALLTGLIPYALLTIGLFLDRDLLSILDLGAYITLFFGLLLVILALRCKVIECQHYQ